MDQRWELPYASRRPLVMAPNVVTTSQPLAAQAGLEMLARKGNAVDAALAAAIALTVVEPTSNGIGGDAFALVWHVGRLHALNGSGRSPAAWSPERFAGRDAMPSGGWDSVTVPGAPHAWHTLSERFGNLSFEDLFEPALRYARDGFAVTPVTAAAWAKAPERYPDNPGFAELFLPDGRAPRAGERFSSPRHGFTLEQIARTRGREFYEGSVADQILTQSKREGGVMTAADLAGHRSEWVDPISVAYRGVEVHETPPPGQGLAALVALGLLQHHDLAALDVDSPDSVHLQIEAVKLGLVEAERHVADPETMAVDPAALLDPDRLAGRAREIDLARAADRPSSMVAGHGTVYLAAADASGMMVSFIQSNFWGFGSGVVVQGTGVAMQNRGYGFTLEPGHPNQVGGGKRPFHTIIPGFVTEGGKASMAFGVMGGHHQAQGHVQMMVRTVDHGQNPQAASDAPRWHLTRDGELLLEVGFDAKVADELERRGHRVRREVKSEVFGGAQAIARIDHGYVAGSDHRKDGQAVGR